jgi:hypothetical protein
MTKLKDVFHDRLMRGINWRSPIIMTKLQKLVSESDAKEYAEKILGLTLEDIGIERCRKEVVELWHVELFATALSTDLDRIMDENKHELEELDRLRIRRGSPAGVQEYAGKLVQKKSLELRERYKIEKGLCVL